MNRYSKLPARFLLVLLGTILIAAGMTSVTLAQESTSFHGSLFDVIEATDREAWFSINSNCDDKDENCAVRVTGDVSGRSETGSLLKWKGELEECTSAATGSGDERFDDFETCWEGKTDFTVRWPTINPGDDFEITPYCESGDDVCAEELRVCFNAHDCDNNEYERRSWTQVGELWDEAGLVSARRRRER